MAWIPAANAWWLKLVTSRLGTVLVAVALVAVAVERRLNGLFHARIDRLGTAQIAAAFFAQPTRQVARSALAVHRLALGGKTKSLFGPFVGLDLRTHMLVCRLAVVDGEGDRSLRRPTNRCIWCFLAPNVDREG